MSDHLNSIYINNCRKTPVNTLNKQHRPIIEKKSSLTTLPFNDVRAEKSINADELLPWQKIEHENLTSVVDFYVNIPDYRDINHLPKQEFDEKLATLKCKQKALNQYIFQSIKHTVNADYKVNIMNKDYRQTMYEKNKDDQPLQCATQHDSLANSLRINDKSVKIYSAQSNNTITAMGMHSRLSNYHNHYNNSNRAKLRSKSASPLKNPPNRYLTVPKLFQMTQREEEEAMLYDLLASVPSPRNKEKSTNIIKANPVSITSTIPLYDKVICEQDHRNQLAKLSSAIELQSKMKPFIEPSNQIKVKQLLRSQTSPALFVTSLTDVSNPHQFRAKPFPQKFFSNHFYYRQWEDEYFRNLNKQLRAEEMLKKSSLPLSMRKHHQTISQPQCLHGLSLTDGKTHCKHKKRRYRKKIPNYCHLHDKMQASLTEKANEFITTCPSPFKFETEKRSDLKLRSNAINKPSSLSMSQHSSKITSLNSSPVPLYPPARQNLAANLRVEWIRKKLYNMSLSDAKDVWPSKQKCIRSSWGVRRTSAWKSLYYDHTNDEDISLRLATRRAEQKLRHEEHQIDMELMRQRVKATPLLLEGTTHWEPKIGNVTQNSKTNASCHNQNLHQKHEKKGQNTGKYSSYQKSYSKIDNYSNYTFLK